MSQPNYSIHDKYAFHFSICPGDRCTGMVSASLRHSWRNAAMSNQRRQFLGFAAGAIAVPATSSLVLAQGNPSRVPERRSAKSELTGLSALLTPEECVVVLIDHQPF